MHARLGPIGDHILEISRDALNNARAYRGIQSDAELARIMGIDPGTLSRELLSKCEPSGRFIAQLLAVFDGVHSFPHLFTLRPRGTDDAAHNNHAE